MDFVSSTFALRRLRVKCYAEVTQALKSFARTEFPNLLRLQKKKKKKKKELEQPKIREKKPTFLFGENVVIN